MALTKADIVERIYMEMGYPKAKSFQVIEALIESLKTSLAAGDDVMISGFGKFCVKEKHARRGRNPATGESAILPARRVVTFKCSGCLRQRVNGQKGASSATRAEPAKVAAVQAGRSKAVF
jgi:integration host factor subunit alpha